MVIIVLSLSLVIFTNLSQIKLCHTNVRRGEKRVQRRFATICEFHASRGSCQANPLKTRGSYCNQWICGPQIVHIFTFIHISG